MSDADDYAMYSAMLGSSKAASIAPMKAIIKKAVKAEVSKKKGSVRTVRKGRYYYGKARTFARKSYRKSYKGYGVNISPAFLIGFAAGMTNLDNNIPAQYSLMAACMPFSGKGIGQIKAGAQGLVLGNIAQGLLNKNVSSSGSAFGI